MSADDLTGSSPVDETTSKSDPTEPDVPVNQVEPAAPDGGGVGYAGQVWSVDDYAPVVTLSGAAKLADSGVAPLVAAARGYWTVTEETYAATRSKIQIDGRSKQAKRFKHAATTEDAMVMPAYRIDEVVSAQQSGEDPRVVYYQFRPATPALNDKGKELKYEVVSGHKLAIGLHPAIPAAWVGDTGTPLLIAEGLLKADSVLTGMLLDAGVPAEALRLVEADAVSSSNARARLAGLLSGFAAEKRVAVASISSCNSWSKKGEWTQVPLRGREAWIGLDADVSSNFSVYREAKGMWSWLEGMRATPKLLSPTNLVLESGEVTDKYGLDDFLSKYGPWSELLKHLSSELPLPPVTDEAERVGQWAVSSDGCSVFEYVKKEDEHGNTVGVAKVDRVPLGGRVLALSQRRRPTVAEKATGLVDESVKVGASQEQVEIEVSWLDHDKQQRSAVVVGPPMILTCPPMQWDRHGAEVPSELRRNPDWPPDKEGMDWLRAVKAHRMDETQHQVEWTSMGWLPVPGHEWPAFVVGGHVICDDVVGDESTGPELRTGVDMALLSGADKFGLGEMDPRPITDPGYRGQVKDEVEQVIDTFILSDAWTDRAMSLLVLACAMRPCLPRRPIVTLCLVGGRGSGKSFSAEKVSQFWTSVPAHGAEWLPGSVSDTAFATERALSMAPLWVMDDLPPSNSKHKADSEQDKVTSAIRSVFSGQGRRRGSADGSERESFDPQALLIITAENQISIDSARQRTITYTFRPGSLHEESSVTDELNELCAEGVPARVTQAFVKWLRHRAKQGRSWAQFVTDVNNTYDFELSAARDKFEDKGKATRAASLAADVKVALHYFSEFCGDMGIDLARMQVFNNTTSTNELLRLVEEAQKVNAKNNVGWSLVSALKSLLLSGKAHVRSLESPQSPPAMQGDDWVAHDLGWRDDGAGNVRPSGVNVGWFVVGKNGEPVVLFDQEVAFAAASKEYPELVRHGTTRETAWAAVWNEGLGPEEKSEDNPKGITRVVTAGNRKLSTCRLGPRGNRRSGVPVELSMIRAGGDRFEANEGRED